MQYQKEYSLQYEFDYKGDLVRPGSYIRVKYCRTAVRYECILHNVNTDRTFLVIVRGNERTLIPISWMRGLVTLKRSRRNVTGTRTN
jgi:hypothetical protein